MDILAAECLLGTDARMRRGGGVLQRLRAEQERKVGRIQSVRCFRAVTGMPVCTNDGYASGRWSVAARQRYKMEIRHLATVLISVAWRVFCEQGVRFISSFGFIKQGYEGPPRCGKTLCFLVESPVTRMEGPPSV